MKILTSEGNVKNAKSYPHWEELYALLKDHEVKKIEGILPLEEIKRLVEWSDVFISIDSFLPHLIECYKIDKKVIVLWGKSDPEIFGYAQNNNLLRDRVFLRNEQFKWWKDEPIDLEAFVSPDEVMKHL
jgi:ADP-heptose:LPS heptosyltransferase